MMYFGDLVRRFVAQIYNLNATLISVPERRGPFLQSDFTLLIRGNALDKPEIQQAGHRMIRNPAHRVARKSNLDGRL
jgi:hypothetical protein